MALARRSRPRAKFLVMLNSFIRPACRPITRSWQFSYLKPPSSFWVFGECPVEVTTTVEVSVVDATRTIAAPPVGEVQHNVERGAEVVLVGFPVLTVNLALPGLQTNAVGVVRETFHGDIAGTDAYTQQRREPFTYIEMSRGSETIHELAVVILVGETDRNATFTLDKPVVREFVEEVALGRIFNISHFLGVLGKPLCRQA